MRGPPVARVLYSLLLRLASRQKGLDVQPVKEYYAIILSYQSKFLDKERGRQETQKSMLLHKSFLTVESVKKESAEDRRNRSSFCIPASSYLNEITVSDLIERLILNFCREVSGLGKLSMARIS